VKCQFCSKPATVHLTGIVDLQKKEMHLCQSCAEEHQLDKHPEVNVPVILQHLIGHYLGSQTDELARLTCPACGIKYMEFRNQGRLGCPHDYEVFRSGLAPLLQRIHRADHHVGKIPRGSVPPAEQQAEVMELRRLLQTAIKTEAYEEAARLRDSIRKKEATDESG
jgi:protein arginine kinase activator